jgi:hypothetical protein
VRSSPAAGIVLGLACVVATMAHGQKRVLVPDDSIGAMVGIESRLLWRDITLADALGLRSGVSFSLLPSRFPIQFELNGWTALNKRSSRSFSDQYSASAHYQWVLANRPHPRSLVFGYSEYWNPTTRPAFPSTRANTRELTASGLFDIGIEQLGIRTVHFQLDAARDLARENATWLRGAANASIGTTIQGAHTDYSLAAILELALSASDLRGSRMPAPRPAFGFHSADAQLDLQFRERMRSVNATTDLLFGTAIRAKRLGANVGWIGIRQSILLL